MKAELRETHPKPPREVVVTMSEEEARMLGDVLLYGDIAGWVWSPVVLNEFGQMLRRVVEEGR